MLTEELIELAKKVCKQKSEEQTIEVKAAHIDCPKRLYDTLSSFSNQDYGGILLFGLDERTDFQIVGIKKIVCFCPSKLVQRNIVASCPREKAAENGRCGDEEIR